MTQTQYLDTWSKERRVGALNDIERKALAMMEAPQATRLISGLDQTKAARVIDISHWNGDCDIQLMKDQGDVAMVIAKMSDGKQVRAGDPTQTKWYKDDWFDRNTQKAYDAHVAFAPYHYVQVGFTDMTIPGIVSWNWKVIKDSLVNKIPGKSYQAFVFDFEEKNAAPGLGAAVMRQLIDLALKDPDLSKVKIILYTSMSVLNYYKDLIQYVGQADCPIDLWMAQWVYTTATKTTWANLISTIIPKIEMKVMTPGNGTWKLLQWSASCVLPGCNGALDLSFYKGEKWRLGAWLGYDFEGTTPPPDDDPVDPPPPAGEVTAAQFAALAARVTAAEQAQAATAGKLAALEAEYDGHIHPVGTPKG